MNNLWPLIACVLSGLVIGFILAFLYLRMLLPDIINAIFDRFKKAKTQQPGRTLNGDIDKRTFLIKHLDLSENVEDFHYYERKYEELYNLLVEYEKELKAEF